jgi:phage shock protein E
LDTLRVNMGKLDAGKPVITCCASGARSNLARNVLLKNGFTEVYNGGSWRTVQRILN